MWSNNSQQVQQRQFPVPAESTYQALKAVVRKDFKLKSDDDFTKSLTFSSGASAFTWGENFSAQVLSVEGGSQLNVSGVGKVGWQIQQSSRTNKLIDQLFQQVTDVLRRQAGK